ncbi:MAG: hypothetical protein K2W82_00655 [Candidatus Obscuribacterales bacterium]|nr:hypothetical protein [Candidatus Obscuribacterales bacterium]
MSPLYIAIITAVVGAVAFSTLLELWKERQTLMRDELSDEIRALAWRTVIFLVFPLIVFLDLRTTIVACDWAGGSIKNWYYGVLWYEAVPQNLPSSELLIPVLFAGVLVQFILAFSLLPALFFRPHPFIATLIGYSLVAIFVDNLIIDPLLAFVGAGDSRWQIVYASVPQTQLWPLLMSYVGLSAIFLLLLRSRTIKLSFAELSQPVVAEQLRIALNETKVDPLNQFQTCRLAILLERAGMKRQATRELNRLRRIASGTLYLPFLEGYLLYRRRQYKKSSQAFEQATRFNLLPNGLRSSFLAASACAAFAQGDMVSALNFAERALEFDDICLVARMVRIDAFLRLGRKDQAGEEVLLAIRQGLDSTSEDRIPLDPELAIKEIFRYQRALLDPSLQPAAAVQLVR